MNQETKIKLTGWYPGHIKPARKGVYQQLNGIGIIGYQRWDGKNWMGWSTGLDRANASREKVYDQYQNYAWRGLAQEPKP